MIATSENWWKTAGNLALSEVISHRNESRLKSNDVDRFQKLAQGMNRLWTELNNYQRRNDPSLKDKRGDIPLFEELLKVSLSKESKERIAKSSSLKKLIGLEPMVMCHDILRRKGYNPDHIPDDLKHEASEKHIDLRKAFLNYSNEQSDDRGEKVLKKLADFLFVIRCNIAHGEKTAYGPDSKKVGRDRDVCKVARPVMELIWHEIFERPDCRLAVYGTLAPGGVNHSLLDGCPGIWMDARICGRIAERSGLPYFFWDIHGDPIEIKILESEKLVKQKWKELDRLEGDAYQRIWAIASTQNGIPIVVNVYQDKNETSDSDESE